MCKTGDSNEHVITVNRGSKQGGLQAILWEQQDEGEEEEEPR